MLEKKLQEKFYDFVSILKNRPGMYIGNDISLRNLKIFLDGVSCGIYIIDEKNIGFGYDFSEFVEKKLGFLSSTAGYSNIIEAYVSGFDPKNISWEKFLKHKLSEEENKKSLELFFELFEEFRENISHPTLFKGQL